MNTVIDILKRTGHMAFFFMPIPVGSYIIHNGSSAVVALVSFLLLSLAVPLAYASFSFSGFGPKEIRLRWWAYIIAWTLIQAVSYLAFTQVSLSLLWNWPTIGRDFAFLIIMYVQVALAILVGYAIGRPFAKVEVIHE